MDKNNTLPQQPVSSLLDLIGIRVHFGGNVSKQDRCIAALHLCDLFKGLNSAKQDWRNLIFDVNLFLPSFSESKSGFYDPISSITFKTSAKEDNSVHSLIVELFTICFGTNPYLGRKFYQKALLNQSTLEHLFVSDRQFVFAPAGSNYPDPHYQSVVTALWDSEAFEQLQRLMKAYFIDGIQHTVDDFNAAIWECLSLIAFGNSQITHIEFEGFGFYALSAGKKLIDPQTHTLLGESLVLTSPDLHGRLGLKNMSTIAWQLTTPSGKCHTIENSENSKNTFPLNSGMRCQINDLQFEVK